MPKIVSSTELRNGYNDVSRWCHLTNEPAFITKNGSGALAVMSMQAYDELSMRREMHSFFDEGRRDALEGRTSSAREHADRLREDYGLR